MLRHDPDIMMIGEVRDIETAEIAIQVALTGHLIFSTLHTNDAASGVTRLLDMGVQPYLTTSTVICFIAQRLVRLICPQCKYPIEDSAEVMKGFGGLPRGDERTVVYAGKGCEACNFSGYMGRAGIYEFLPVTDEVKQLIMQRATADQIKAKAVEQGMVTLQQAGWHKVKQGLTSPQEVIRVIQDE